MYCPSPFDVYRERLSYRQIRFGPFPALRLRYLRPRMSDVLHCRHVGRSVGKCKKAIFLIGEVGGHRLRQVCKQKATPGCNAVQLRPDGIFYLKCCKR
jgi:hypothetical protein